MACGGGAVGWAQGSGEGDCFRHRELCVLSGLSLVNWKREQKFPSTGVEMPVGEREDTGKTDHLGI